MDEIDIKKRHNLVWRLKMVTTLLWIMPKSTDA